MAHSEAHDIKKEIRGYMAVFLALAGLTILTVVAAGLDVSTRAHIIIAMLIAVVKGGLVASFFMHLISEKKLIISTLLLTVFFFLVLMFVPISHYLDRLDI